MNAIDGTSNPQFLNEDGTPNMGELQTMFQRCGPTVAGGLAWLDNTRFCKWEYQWVDGKKHDVPGAPGGAAFPFDGASDVRPMVVDDIINERAAMLQHAFWLAETQPGSVGTDDDAGSYAVALWEHLMYSPRMFTALVREVELSAQYMEHYGWVVLAPRWRRQLGIKKRTVYLDGIRQAALQEQQQQQQAGLASNAPSATPGEGTNGDGAEGVPTISQGGAATSEQSPPGLMEFVAAIMDPLREGEAAEFMMDWYDNDIATKLPEDMQDQAPTVSKKQATKAVKDLRQTGKAIVPLPYLARDEAEIVALKPWDEVFIPPELTSENEIVFQVERLHESDLKNRIKTDGYDKAWVELAVKYKGALSAAPMEIRTTPVGIGGLVGGATSSPVFAAQPTLNNTLIEIVHAIYHGIDDDGIPAIYCTTYHRQVQDTYAKHEIVDGAEGELPYSAGVREWWCRSIVASRSVPERAHTQQNIIKGTLDSVLDRASMCIMPPVNVYESPTGTRYKFGPAKQNYVKQGREPAFMQMPTGDGMSEGMEVLQTVKAMVDNSYALMSGDVNQPRLQMSQGTAAQKFLAMWNKAKQQVLNLCRIHMDDDDFAAITGAPAGWLDAHREDTDCLSCQFHFDVRELDPELNLKRIESMNSIALPNDVLGVINRGQWAKYMVRAILGPRAAKQIVTSVPDASAALKEKAEGQILKMFAGNQPTLMDKEDPTAASMLQLSVQNVMGNPVYLGALNDDALQLLSQVSQMPPQQVGAMAQQAGRKPDDRFSELLISWLKNLQFIGVTQQQNKQVGRTGVNQAGPGPNGGGN